MDRKKFIAVFVVACMLAVTFVGVTTADVSESADSNRSDKTVTIDVNGTFESNRESLKTLGITDPDMWTYNCELGCNQLEIRDIEFRTSAAVALELTGDGDDVSFALKLSGENTIRSGTPANNPGYSYGIYAENTSLYGDFALFVLGEGKLSVGNDVRYGTKPMNVAAIQIEGTLDVRDGAELNAIVGEAVYPCTQDPGETTLSSIGISAHRLVITSDPDGPYTKVNAFSGSVILRIYDNDVKFSGLKISSIGISAPSLVARYSFINTVADNVGLTGDLNKASGNVEATSIGLSTNRGDGSHETDIRSCNITAVSLITVGLTRSISKGMELRSDSAIKIVDSIIKTTSYDSKTVSGDDGTLSASFATEFYSKTLLQNTLLVSSSDKTEGAKSNISLGIHCRDDLYLKGSIVHTTSEQWIGLCLLKGKTAGDYAGLHIDDSDIYSKGGRRAVNADPDKIYASSTDWKFFNGEGADDKVIELRDIGQIASKDLNDVSLGYAYDVIFKLDNYTYTDFMRSESQWVIAPEYEGYVPDGMKFDGWDTGKTVLKSGQMFKVDTCSTLTAKFAKASENDNTQLTICVIILAIIALILLAMAFVRR